MESTLLTSFYKVSMPDRRSVYNYFKKKLIPSSDKRLFLSIQSSKIGKGENLMFVKRCEINDAQFLTAVLRYITKKLFPYLI